MKIVLAVIFLVVAPISNIISQGSMKTSGIPEWAKKAVWYQIFPERFANGDPANDPSSRDIEGSWPHSIPPGWSISPWTSDWYKLQPWEEANGHDFYWNSGVRRYGGDIQGIIDRLGYLQDLGITAIYLNPIFDSPSSHKYDTRMYHHVDRNFGPRPAEDVAIIATENPADPSTWKWTSADSLFLKLVKEVHHRAMKIILDGVFNHVGSSFWAFQDVVRNQQRSAYKDWFYIRSWDNPATPASKFSYQGWNGVRDLPEVKKEGKYRMAEGFAEHIHSVVKRWMDPNGDGDPSDGIDGWRLDVAEKVDIVFWRQFRRWVRDVNPDAYITGEIWWQDWQANKMFNAAPWLQGDVFDGVMNYRFARAVKKLVADQRMRISPHAFADTIDTIAREYPLDHLTSLQNLLDSHDVDRVASQVVNPDRSYDHNANPSQNRSYLVRKPSQKERAKQMLMVGIQMTMPGTPMIYYGDEAGMWGGDDPDCRKPMVWPEMTYESEVTDPLGRPREPDTVRFDAKLFEWYKTLIALRKDNVALSEGTLRFIELDDRRNIIGYARTLGASTIVVFVNNNESAQSVTAKRGTSFEPGKRVRDLLRQETLLVNDSGVTLQLKPYGISILRQE